MKQRLMSRRAQLREGPIKGSDKHFYVPTIIDEANPNKSVSDNLDGIQSTLLNFNEQYQKKMEDLDAKIAKLVAFEHFPVGSLYLSVDNINPRDKFGYGNWHLTSEGRALVGAGGGKVLGQWGGQYETALNEAHLPSHKHDVTVGNLSAVVATEIGGGAKTTDAGGAHNHQVAIRGSTLSGDGTSFRSSNGGSSQMLNSTAANAHTHTLNIDHNHSVNISHGHAVSENYRGGNAPFNIEQPYIVVNVWQRAS